ncbi:MAG TPA: Ig-like domain-containing protein [Kofleriaceae bacterium]|nr:Ig-like domain-containing protein [Kofleriaceae bacterium]
MTMREAPSCTTGRAWTSSHLSLVMGIALGLVACSDDRSATELNPDGPPMVRQVFVQEKLFAEGGVVRERFGLAFGDHPDIPSTEDDPASGDDRVVENAVAFGGSVKMRVVVDELLRGNDLEEIQCSDDTYSRVPVGTTPDDIEDCSGVDLSKCTAVCIGEDGPVGIKDMNGDGAVDDNLGYGIRMIDYGDGELGISVTCDDVAIPLLGAGPARTFYNPSGNQLIPAGAGIDGLGPALVVIPAQGLRTGSSCTIGFRPEVVDKDGNRICAPPDGDPKRDCAGNGDTSAIAFRVEPLAFSSTEPDEGDTLALPNATVLLEFVAPVDLATLDSITMATGAGDDVPIEVTQVDKTDATNFRVVAPGGYLPGTEYTITVGTGLTDLLGGTPPAPFALHFTTSGDAADAGPEVDAGPGPDAGPPDAAL